MDMRVLLRDPRYQFWLLHIGGWALWGALGKYGYTVYMDFAPPGYGYYVVAITLMAILLCLPLRWLYRYTWDSAFWQRALAFAGGSFVVSWTWLSCRSYLYARWFEGDADIKDWVEKFGAAAEFMEKMSFHESQFAGWVLILAWSTGYFAIKYARIFREVRESALKAAAMAHEAQLKMLRYQLNPHFLFNTLNAISTLILEHQTEPANRMVTKLSSFLRYSLDNDPMQRITLRQEIEALRLYLDIEKVRFEDRLQLELDIESGAETALIPGLLLQPLVENAIKHGISQVECGGVLRIAARVFAGELLLEISDNGPGVELVNGNLPNGRGVGLRNTRERLRELYGAAHSFRLAGVSPHGLGIHIRIPCEREQERR
jgi:two-component sensor histidine kinase